MKKVGAGLVLATLGGFGLAHAEQVTTYRATEETTVTTTPEASAAPSTQETAVQPAGSAQVTEAVQGPSESDAEALSGTVQSVDRWNRSLVLQDHNGRNYRISLTNDTRFFRRGSEIGYRDIEPNDVIQIHYAS